VADITSRINQGIAVFDVKPSMNLDLVPKFLILHDSKDSWLSGYRVPVPNQRGQVRLGAPYVYVAHYDRSNKDLTVAVRVECCHQQMMHRHMISPPDWGSATQHSVRS